MWRCATCMYVEVFNYMEMWNCRDVENFPTFVVYMHNMEHLLVWQHSHVHISSLWSFG